MTGKTRSIREEEKNWIKIRRIRMKIRMIIIIIKNV